MRHLLLLSRRLKRVSFSNASAHSHFVNSSSSCPLDNHLSSSDLTTRKQSPKRSQPKRRVCRHCGLSTEVVEIGRSSKHCKACSILLRAYVKDHYGRNSADLQDSVMKMLPPYAHDLPVLLIDRESQLPLLKSHLDAAALCGIDTETRPPSTRYPTSLIQIATKTMPMAPLKVGEHAPLFFFL